MKIVDKKGETDWLPRTYKRPCDPARGRGRCRMSRIGLKPAGEKEETTDDNLKLRWEGWHGMANQLGPSGGKELPCFLIKKRFVNVCGFLIKCIFLFFSYNFLVYYLRAGKVWIGAWTNWDAVCKNPSYGRHWLSRRVWIIAWCQKIKINIWVRFGTPPRF